MAVEYSSPLKPRKWYEIWWDIWTHPGEKPFIALLNEPDHSPTRAFIWVALTTLIIALFTGLFSTGLVARSLNIGSANNLTNYLCLVIFTPLAGILGLVISTGIYHAIARLFGSQGAWSALLICFAAVTASSAIVGGVMSAIILLLVAVPLAFIFPWALSILASIYASILYINALRVAEKLDTGKAVLVYFIPVIVIVLLVLCSFAALLPVVRNTGI